MARLHIARPVPRSHNIVAVAVIAGLFGLAAAAILGGLGWL